jgi:histidine ammonia-lyase
LWISLKWLHAIELLTAAQALEFRLPLNPGRGVKKAYNIVRGSVPPTESDRSMSTDIEKIVDLIRRDEFQDLLN